MGTEEETHFFGHWVALHNKDEFIEAETYLRLWKKFFLRSLPETLVFKSETWVELPGSVDDPLWTIHRSLALKLEFTENIERGKEELSMEPFRKTFRYVCIQCLRTFLDSVEKHDQFCWKCGGNLEVIGGNEKNRSRHGYH